jgi:hypothetical protein
MHLDKLCSIEFRYLDAHFPKPYGDESGPGWGIGEGTVSGERLSGTLKWSNHPSLRSDGVALPDFRGVISTADGAKVQVSLTGRTVFVPRGNETVGRQLLMALFESDDAGDLGSSPGPIAGIPQLVERSASCCRG